MPNKQVAWYLALNMGLGSVCFSYLVQDGISPSSDCALNGSIYNPWVSLIVAAIITFYARKPILEGLNQGFPKGRG